MSLITVPCRRRAVFQSPLAMLVVAVACTGILLSGTTSAATINVAAGVSVVAADGNCSLAEAINNANSDSQQDNTDCVAGEAGSDTLELANAAFYVLGSALPVVNSSIVIRGNGALLQRSGTTTCTPNGTLETGEFRIVTQVGGMLQLSDLTLRNGCADGAMSATSDGAGIRVDNGTLVLIHVTIEDNVSWDKSGAIDATNAMVSISDSILRNNSAGFGGGAIGNDTTATMDIVNTTISGNTASGFGGAGIGNRGTMTVVNSTISGNMSTPIEAGGGGGGVGNSGDITLVNVTIADNSDNSGGGVGGGGIANSGNVTIRNSIVADNSTGGDCVSLAGTFSAVDVNLDTDGTCKALDATFTTTTSAALALEVLADNGGLTPTRLPGPTGPAIDAIGTCMNDGVALAEDQRGIARPQVDGCDLGAVELTLLEQELLFRDGFE